MVQWKIPFFKFLYKFTQNFGFNKSFSDPYLVISVVYLSKGIGSSHLLEKRFWRRQESECPWYTFPAEENWHGESLNWHNSNPQTMLLHWQGNSQPHQKRKWTWGQTRYRLAGALWGSLAKKNPCWIKNNGDQLKELCSLFWKDLHLIYKSVLIFGKWSRSKTYPERK